MLVGFAMVFTRDDMDWGYLLLTLEGTKLMICPIWAGICTYIWLTFIVTCSYTVNSPARAYMSFCCVFLCFSCKRRYRVFVRVLFHPSIGKKTLPLQCLPFASVELARAMLSFKGILQRNMKLLGFDGPIS